MTSTKPCLTFKLSSLPMKRKTNWPFLYYQDTDGAMKHNPVVQTSAYTSATYVGEALL